MAASTGSALLPDIGTFSYNGVTWSSLYSSFVNGKEVLDNAGRTVKYMKYTITIDGVVTLDRDAGAITVDNQWQNVLRKKLTQQAGTLIYSGKGFGNQFTINKPGGTLFDVAWGPIPEILDFTPLGASRSARIKFVVTTCIPEIASLGSSTGVLQFNNETSVSYDEAGFSHLSIKGTLEIPLTRPSQPIRRLTTTVDDFRQKFMAAIASGFDMSRFQVVKRDFSITRDKRTLEWDFQLDELPWMGLPGGILDATGSVSMRPLKSPRALQGNVQWLCTMRATYIVPNGQARRLAWLAFLALWNFRMRQSEFGLINPNGIAAGGGAANAVNAALGGAAFNAVTSAAGNYQRRYTEIVLGAINANRGPENVLKAYDQAIRGLVAPSNVNKSFPLSLSFEEGLYKDSKTVTFEATWRFLSLLSNVLVASGLWRKTGLEGGNFWATSIRNISAGRSWYENKLDLEDAAIVDFGGGGGPGGAVLP